MAAIIINADFDQRLTAIDAEITALNKQKTALLLEAAGIKLTKTELDALLDWELLVVNVPDRGIMLQLNKLCRYVPNLKFTHDKQLPPFTIRQGTKARRIWKNRE